MPIQRPSESSLISVVIPTLNEESHILRTLASVESQSGEFETIVVDGGSTDKTLVVLPASVSTVISSSAGRGRQMNAGAAVANGSILLFLHADTSLPPTAFDEIRRAVTSGSVGGIFRLRFDAPTVLLRISAFATRIKSKKICFGDRAIFADRRRFDEIGGFADMPIFEDLDFVTRLSKAGPFAHLKQSVQTSARRYHESGDWLQQWRNLVLWHSYHTGGDPIDLAQKYQYKGASEK